MPSAYDRDRVARAARIYPSTTDAARALGIKPGTFSRLCTQYGIDTPQARTRKARAAAKDLQL